MKILGRIIDDDGIRMDPDKVDSVLNWKVPTNKELLRGFLGSVGYLADDIATVRIPMGILTSLTGSDSSGSTVVARSTTLPMLPAFGLSRMGLWVELPEWYPRGMIFVRPTWPLSFRQSCPLHS